jgi:hypothetical protein
VLRITIPLGEGYDEESGEFVDLETYVVDLEHSLLSMSKWESKWEKVFLDGTKTEEQTLDYIRMMVLGPEIDEKAFSCLTAENIKQIDEYINAKMTATTFPENKQPPKKQEIVTAEIIYYWMFSLGIPLELENWHLTRLLTLIRVFNAKNAPKEKVSKADAARQRRELNEQRRKQLGTSG